MKKKEVYEVSVDKIDEEAKPFLLAEKGVSQEEVAAATGLSVGSISSYRHGQKDPRLSAIIAIAEYLQIDAHYLLTGVKAENRSAVKKYGLSQEALSRLETAQRDFQDIYFTLPTLSRLLSSETFWKFLRDLAIFDHECSVAESRRAIQAETPEEERRTRADYNFARYDKAVLRHALHDDLARIMDETEA